MSTQNIDFSTSSEQVNTMGGVDISVLVIYIIGIIALGCWSGLGKKQKSKSAKDYFLAGGKLRWPMIGLALFATNISTVHLVSLAQEGFTNGLLFGVFEWSAIFLLVLLAVFFTPFYIRSEIATLPDFLEKRYSRSCRDWLAVISVMSAIVIHIGFALYTGAVVLQGMFGFPLVWSIIGVAVLTGLYTTVGGLMAVVLTESIQTAVLLIGALCLTWFCWDKIGSWDMIVNTVRPEQLSLMRAHGDPTGLPWYSVILGIPVLGVFYWCADQTIVQRILGAEDENHARVGALFAGFIKILPVFIFIFPGLMFYVIMQNGLLPESVMPTKILDGKSVMDTSQTYAVMIKELLPTGIRGLVAAALLSALMSTVSGALNSISTLVSYDLYKRFKPDADDQHLVKIGRISCVIAIIVSIILSVNYDKLGSIMAGVNTMISYIAAPITAVFVLGIFWRKASSTGALTCLITGCFVAVGLLICEITGMNIFGETPFLMVAFYLCCAYMLLMVVISIAKPHVHTTESEKLYWKSPLEALQGEAWKGFGNYKLLSALLLMIMFMLFYTFR